jgi:hypothetical protein
LTTDDRQYVDTRVAVPAGQAFIPLCIARVSTGSHGGAEDEEENHLRDLRASV